MNLKDTDPNNLRHGNGVTADYQHKKSVGAK
jgi:hypothetical protein